MDTVARRRILRWLVGVSLVVAIALGAIPFFASFGVTPRAENDKLGTYDFSTMSQGELKKFDYFWVYRRTESDKSNVDRYRLHLADPDSKLSRQPPSAANTWRSENPDFFVFFPWAPIRSCSVVFIESGSRVVPSVPEASIVSRAPHFYEACEGRTFDVSGRLFHRPNYPQEQNLTVPDVKWFSKTQALVRRY